MKLRVLLVNMPVTLSVSLNLKSMIAVLREATSGSVVLFPEGAISGYSPDMRFLKSLETNEYQLSIEKLKEISQARGVDIWAGSALLENGRWMNAAVGITSDGEISIYRKVNLANAERGHFGVGNELHTYNIHRSSSQKIAIQLCRELRFPEQWGFLARQGARAFFHLNNAVGNAEVYDVWRSHLISRAAENERFVFSVNNASDAQNSPTIAIGPGGKVLVEVSSEKLVAEEIEVDLAMSSEILLSQSRSDIVRIDKP